jgi:hypothetical protein
VRLCVRSVAAYKEKVKVNILGLTKHEVTKTIGVGRCNITHS